MKTKNGKKLYKFAKTIIPGGTTLFSKRSELHLPNEWPAYFSKAKKTNVWDLKGNKYLDMFCAVGTSIFGYSDDNINFSLLKSQIKNLADFLNIYKPLDLALISYVFYTVLAVRCFLTTSN